jgi:F-type H+-transporting ATPase subunit alpha
MDIRAAEISAILKEQIRNFGREAEVTEVGQVLQEQAHEKSPSRLR